MEGKPPRPMTPFDELVTPPFLYTLKLLLPHIPSGMQRTLAILLKFFELQNTMSVFFGFQGNGSGTSAEELLDGLKPYMSPEEQDMMEQMEGMMSMMEMMQQMPPDSPA